MPGDPFAGGHAFRELADHARENYLKFAYTKGTKQEAEFLRETLRLHASARVLDVACGVGRHERHLPWRVVGADLSRAFLEVARRDHSAQARGSRRGEGGRGEWVQADARHLPFKPVFDAAWSFCEGAFGLLPDDAAHVEMLRSVRACLKPGAPFVLSAMSVFAMCADEHFDLRTNTMSTPQMVESPGGKKRKFVVTTRAFAPREIIEMARAAGFEVQHVWGGVTGAYERRALTIEDPEMLVVMRAPSA